MNATAQSAVGLRSTLRSEWTKLWATPSTVALIAVTGVLTVGITVLITVFGGQEALVSRAGENQYQVVFYGSSLGVFAYAFLAAGFVASEYRTGMITYTLTATNRRSRVLTSKLLIIAVLGYVAGLAISVVNVGVMQGGLAASGLAPMDPVSQSLGRAVLVFTGLGMAVQGSLAAMLATMFRNSTTAVITLILVNTLPVIAAQFLGQAYANSIPRFLPGALLESLAGLSVPGTAGYLPWPGAALGLACWLVIALAGALLVMRKRDA